MSNAKDRRRNQVRGGVKKGSSLPLKSGLEEKNVGTVDIGAIGKKDCQSEQVRQPLVNETSPGLSESSESADFYPPFVQAGEVSGSQASRSTVGWGQLRKKVGESRWPIALWVFNLLIGGIAGVWFTGIFDCLPKAKDKVKYAVSSVGYLDREESCFILPPAFDSKSNKDAVTVAREAISDAEATLEECRLRCLFGNCCRGLRREVRLAKANIDLLTGDCAGALKGLDALRHANDFGSEEAITWAWAKVESDPSDSSYGEAIELLGSMPEDACVATTKGALLRRLALSQESGGKELLDSALKEHDRSILLEPKSVLANYNRAVVLIDLGDIDRAQQALDSTKDHLGGRSDPYWHNAQAMIHSLRGDQQGALDELDAAVETGVPDIEFRLSRGWVLYELGRYRDAIRDFSRAEEMLSRNENSCQSLPSSDLEAEIQRGLAKSQFKQRGIEGVEIVKMRLALKGVTDPELRQKMEADLAEFSVSAQGVAGQGATSSRH